jgi:predicted RNase H-like HicB family nuclease
LYEALGQYYELYLLQTAQALLPRRHGGRRYPRGYNRSVKFIVTYEPDEDGGIVAECPALPGCVSHGATMEEAKTNIQAAITLSLKVRRELDLPSYLEVEEIEVAV